MNADRQILRELYELYAARVFQRCRYLLQNEDDARDAMHDVFIKVYKNMDTFRGQASRLTWINRIATNHCLNVLRSRRASWRQSLEQLQAATEQVRDQAALSFERHQLVRSILSKCPKKLEEPAIFYFVDDMTQEEIAALLGISLPTLRKRLRGFLKIARKELQRVDPGVLLKEPVL